MALDLEEIDRSMSFHPSEATVISCGTVTVDPVKQRVLLIWNKKLKIHQLPKGRKNIGEDMLSAAMRETYEETGVRATPLSLKIATRATLPSYHSPSANDSNTTITSSSSSNTTGTPTAAGGGPESQSQRQRQQQQTNGKACRASPDSELQQQPCSSNGSNGGGCETSEITEGRLSTEFLGCCRYPDPQSSTPAMKVVFFFAATADSTVPRGPGDPADWEKLEAVWTPAAGAAAMLRFKAEAEIVKKALEDARRSGYPMAG